VNYSTDRSNGPTFEISEAPSSTLIYESGDGCDLTRISMCNDGAFRWVKFTFAGSCEECLWIESGYSEGSCATDDLYEVTSFAGDSTDVFNFMSGRINSNTLQEISLRINGVNHQFGSNEVTWTDDATTHVEWMPVLGSVRGFFIELTDGGKLNFGLRIS
jgi:hypothetical protein